MKEIVLVTLAIDTETGEIDPKAPFMVNSRRRGTRYNRPYHDEPASSSNSVRASGRRGSRLNGRMRAGNSASVSPTLDRSIQRRAICCAGFAVS
jgi:hypothetical protein